MKRKRILNSKGKPMRFSRREKKLVIHNQRKVNALGYEVDITSLTAIVKRVVEQKFFQVAPANYLPIRVGEGAWNSNMITYREFSPADDFSTGILNLGSNNARLAQAETGVDAVPVKIYNWAKTMGYTLFDLEQASRSGNWDIVTAKERSRKRNWDLGVQKVAFTGLQGSNNKARGLLNLAGVTTNTTLIQEPISGMTPAELKTFLTALLGAYRTNANFTAFPTHFIMPETDYLGLAAPASSDFPMRSTLDLLLETLRVMTGNPNFQILPLSYADAINNPNSSNQIYTFLNYDEDSIRMDIPVDYNNTLANSLDNFSFQNVGYGQFTGVVAYRPAEVLYFAFAA